MSSIGSPQSVRLGIDFGTTNTVVVLLDENGQPHPARFSFPHHEATETCRSLLCLWHEEMRAGRASLHEAIGAAAIDAYLEDPAESRLIMSMKSYLAQASFRQTRLLGRIMTLEMLIARFLACLMHTIGIDPAHVTATVGRPVHFAGEGVDDAFGEQRLRDSFRAAGFHHVNVALEPEAAGWRFAHRLGTPATVLVGDFGGGTSDFSILRFDPDAPQRATPLGYAGVGIAGDQFDYRIIDNVVAPELGRHATYRVMGGAPLPVPAEWYASLGRWHRLALMRTPQTLRDIADVARTASEPEKLHALKNLIDDQQGQALYRAVGAAKRDLSRTDRTVLRYDHRDLHIHRDITRADFESWIAPDLHRFDEAVQTALDRANLPATAIDRVFLTGGTSFVPAVRDLFTRRFGAERVDMGGEFVSVAEGLALMNEQAASPTRQ
ncbi:Hsp70 family protein [Gluconacetobacter entanii]|uniref:Hsp70 family protein n=1 Tax=Gluconacetobacter entanii TaxID=108528 RepID=UPI001C931A6B|nr:Hsp70 family protein [Gluconacetobacter entanii]MBY4641600.1 Hsp70 family protein [Gluconacetobacter entanii]MCW4579366.1 Hsp70 family protein [Gluconacetobacter entanii]MCW4582754.1 Hsp70 family protein [Gluconacetobacter entanii]MCW4586168.1 Hsp70 family protein [Gluconacetobacter entanii]